MTPELSDLIQVLSVVGGDRFARPFSWHVAEAELIEFIPR